MKRKRSRNYSIVFLVVFLCQFLLTTFVAYAGQEIPQVITELTNGFSDESDTDKDDLSMLIEVELEKEYFATNQLNYISSRLNLFCFHINDGISSFLYPKNYQPPEYVNSRLLFFNFKRIKNECIF